MVVVHSPDGYINIEETVKNNNSSLPATLEDIFCSSLSTEAIFSAYDKLVPNHLHSSPLFGFYLD